MSEKTVEAVVRALAESNGDDPDEQVQMFFTKGEGPLWENYSGMARAAIEAYEAEKRRENMVNTYNPLSVPDGSVNAWEGRKK